MSRRDNGAWGRSDMPPPTYRSPSALEEGTAIPMARSILSTSMGPGSLVYLHGEPAVPVDTTGHSSLSNLEEDSDVDADPTEARMLQIHYESADALVQATSNFNKLVMMARKLYFIDSSIHLDLEVAISGLHMGQVRVDSRAWKDLYGSISEIWLTTLPTFSRDTRTIYLVSIGNELNAGQPIGIKVPSRVTIIDVKHCLARVLAQSDISSFKLWTLGRYSCEVSGTLTDGDSALDDYYYVDGLTVGSVRRELESEERAILAFCRLMVMHYGGCLLQSVLTRWSNRYEDIERSARRLFLIPEDAAILISARITTIHNEKVRIEPGLWTRVNKDIAEIWVTIRLAPPKYKFVTLSGVSPGLAPSLSVKVEEGAIIMDLKRALNRAYQDSPITEIQIYNSGDITADDTPVLEATYGYQAHCDACQHSKDFWWFHSFIRTYYAGPEHRCLDPMGLAEAAKHSSVPQPDWPQNLFRWTGTLFFSIISFPGIVLVAPCFGCYVYKQAEAEASK
ncbi:hypothetical protein M408DRAFT_324201 [Serendipita vermifera MAFF 305830]|uniref:Uncharacterized protein n=1 Tax=Serendipita vermifera MAFF 305830 TaxID=933852 RepID=A0A0C2W6I8_SERVB|nr:hypothetical protein M408DRAFT_324201 [Serendipita vermifera MAFF 305830]